MGGFLASFSLYYKDVPTVSQNSHSFHEDRGGEKCFPKVPPRSWEAALRTQG